MMAQMEMKRKPKPTTRSPIAKETGDDISLPKRKSLEDLHDSLVSLDSGFGEGSQNRTFSSQTPAVNNNQSISMDLNDLSVFEPSHSNDVSCLSSDDTSQQTVLSLLVKSQNDSQQVECNIDEVDFIKNIEQEIGLTRTIGDYEQLKVDEKIICTELEFEDESVQDENKTGDNENKTGDNDKYPGLRESVLSAQKRAKAVCKNLQDACYKISLSHLTTINLMLYINLCACIAENVTLTLKVVSSLNPLQAEAVTERTENLVNTMEKLKVLESYTFCDWFTVKDLKENFMFYFTLTITIPLIVYMYVYL